MALCRLNISLIENTSGLFRVLSRFVKKLDITSYDINALRVLTVLLDGIRQDGIYVRRFPSFSELLLTNPHYVRHPL